MNSRAAAVSTKTVRFYEQSGLLLEPARTSSGYRDYTSDTTHRLHFIRTAQTAGLALIEIRDIRAIRDSGQAPCEHVADLADDRLAGLRAAEAVVPGPAATSTACCWE